MSTLAAENNVSLNPARNQTLSNNLAKNLLNEDVIGENIIKLVDGTKSILKTSQNNSQFLKKDNLFIIPFFGKDLKPTPNQKTKKKEEKKVTYKVQEVDTKSDKTFNQLDDMAPIIFLLTAFGGAAKAIDLAVYAKTGIDLGLGNSSEKNTMNKFMDSIKPMAPFIFNKDKEEDKPKIVVKKNVQTILVQEDEDGKKKRFII